MSDFGRLQHAMILGQHHLLYYLRLVNDDTRDDSSDSSSDDISLDHSCELFKNDIFAELEWLKHIDGLIFDQRATMG